MLFRSDCFGVNAIHTECESDAICTRYIDSVSSSEKGVCSCSRVENEVCASYFGSKSCCSFGLDCLIDSEGEGHCVNATRVTNAAAAGEMCLGEDQKICPDLHDCVKSADDSFVCKNYTCPRFEGLLQDPSPMLTCNNTIEELSCCPHGMYCSAYGLCTDGCGNGLGDQCGGKQFAKSCCRGENLFCEKTPNDHDDEYAECVNCDNDVNDQCGGLGFSGQSCCGQNHICTYVNMTYSMCLPMTTSTCPNNEAFSICSGEEVHECCGVGFSCVYEDLYHVHACRAIGECTAKVGDSCIGDGSSPDRKSVV